MINDVLEMLWLAFQFIGVLILILCGSLVLFSIINGIVIYFRKKG